jgi:uncharacterized protein (TIGR02118 family)
MIKIVFCLHRLPHLSREEFQHYWREVHAPLVERWAGVLGIRRYVQCHTADDSTFAGLAASRGGVPAYDGVAELWIDDDTSSRTAPRDEAVRAARELLEDEKKFIDLSRSPIFHVREHEPAIGSILDFPTGNDDCGCKLNSSI